MQNPLNVAFQRTAVAAAASRVRDHALPLTNSHGSAGWLFVNTAINAAQGSAGLAARAAANGPGSGSDGSIGCIEDREFLGIQGTVFTVDRWSAPECAGSLTVLQQMPVGDQDGTAIVDFDTVDIARPALPA